MHRIVPVNLRASEMREVGWYRRALARARQEGIPRLRRTLDALILHSWFPSCRRAPTTGP